MTNDDWRRYLSAFHDARPGITERVLDMVEPSPYRWLVEPLRGTPGLIVDVACGSAPTREHVPHARWLGVDASAGELATAAAAARGPLVRARADALPLPSAAAQAICAAMCLQVVTPLAGVLDEIARILRPGGVLVALVPARLGLSPRGWVRWAQILRAAGITHQRWPNPHACDRVGTVLARDGFEIVSNQRHIFRFPLHSAESAAVLIDSLYLPHTDPDRIVAAKRALGRRARSGRTLPLPLRRVVARRP